MLKKPIRLCIIDDIPTVVQGIAKKIPWDQYGITVVGTAANGEEGIGLIRETRPHIILTDIRMPKLSGIDMIKEVTGDGESPPKVIFLSGYSDFAYAQESIRLGAFDYVLKPFTPGQVVDVVLRAKRELESEQMEYMNLVELQQKVRESMPYLRQEYFRLLLRCVSQPANTEAKWEFLNIEMDREGFAVIVAEIDGFEHDLQSMPVVEAELIRFSVQNILEETIGEHTKGIVFREQLHQLVAIVNAAPEADAGHLAELCRHNVERYAKRTVSIGLGARVKEAGDIHHSFDQAKTALSYHFYTGGNCVIHFHDIEHRGATAPHYTPEKETELLYCLRSGNKEGVERQLLDIFKECIQYPGPPDPQLFMNLFYGLAFTMYRSISGAIGEGQQRAIETKIAAMRSGNTKSLDELKSSLFEIGTICCEWMQKQQNRDSQRLIVEAIRYIEENLGSELTVQECANVVHLSPSYFSNLFKKETGSTFMQYVTAARMERAKEMLLCGIQVQEISYELGYKDRPYFSELFKKHTGMTPSEFRSKYAE
ncbi:helix-turn-helix domain-containing protein [Paenibacillus tarimensis]